MFDPVTVHAIGTKRRKPEQDTNVLTIRVVEELTREIVSYVRMIPIVLSSDRELTALLRTPEGHETKEKQEYPGHSAIELGTAHEGEAQDSEPPLPAPFARATGKIRGREGPHRN